MCASLQQLAILSGHSSIETECSTNQACDGMRCRIIIPQQDIYYMEKIVFPCEGAFVMVVENSQFHEIDSFWFNQTETRDVEVLGLSLTLAVTLTLKEYSMLVGVSAQHGN